MEFKVMERLGAIRYAHTEKKVHELENQGYKVIETKTEATKPEPEAETTEAEAPENTEVEDKNPLESLTSVEIRSFLDKAGINYPSRANKAMLVDIAETNGISGV